MKNPMLELQKKLKEWQQAIEEASKREGEARAQLVGRIEALEDRVKELEVFRDFMEGFNQ